jgi:hypothetical protein
MLEAILYDIGKTLNDDLVAAKWKIPVISGLVLHLSTHPKMLERYLRLAGYDQVIGHHYFASFHGTNTPVFAFDQVSQFPYPLAQVSKVAETDAPRSAFPGLQQEGAIPWLHLTDTTGVSSGGVDTVYRLETAGGKGPMDCKDRGPSFEVHYAAQCEKSPPNSGKPCI